MNGTKLGCLLGCSMESKPCNSCGMDKPLDAFCRHLRGYLGRSSRCKQCDKEYRTQPDVAMRYSDYAKARDKVRGRHCTPAQNREYARTARLLLKDSYIISLMTKRLKVSATVLRDNPLLIELFRKALDIKRGGRGVKTKEVITPQRRMAKRVNDARYKLRRKIQSSPNHPKVSEWRLKLAEIQ